jgi:hypothetical protein
MLGFFGHFSRLLFWFCIADVWSIALKVEMSYIWL